MIGYSQAHVFCANDLELLKRAIAIVRRMPAKLGGEWVRCHELARVVGEVLDLPVFDGKYGVCDHSWLVTPNRVVLDPYVPARVPQVQLVDAKASCLANAEYRTGPDRTDILADVIAALRGHLAGGT